MSQVGASPLGLRPSPCLLFLDSCPAMSCFNGVPFLVPVGWVLCYMYSARSCKWFTSLWAETPHSSQDMGSAGLSMPALSPSLPASGQHLSCRREPGRGLTFGFEAPQLIFLSVRFRNQGAFAGLAYRLGSSVAVCRQTHMLGSAAYSSVQGLCFEPF